MGCGRLPRPQERRGSERTSLHMKKIAAVLVALGLGLFGIPAGAGPSAGGLASDNVEWVSYVPFDVGTASGAKIIGKFMYVTSWRNFSIYDVSDPLDPQLVSTTPFGFA